jgi:xyloglucan-specific endo-beta-1,4-glucanase
VSFSRVFFRVRIIVVLVTHSLLYNLILNIFTMKFTQVVPFLFTSLVLAAPAPAPDKTLKPRSTQICGQWDSVVTGTYTVYQDLWGESAATSGSQCTTVDSLTSGTIVWSTSWSWAGGSSSVKSYANVALTTTGVQLSSISTIPTVWDYR